MRPRATPPRPSGASRRDETGPPARRSLRSRAELERAPDLRAERVRAALADVPRGRVATYGQLAAEAHLPGRARLAARVLRELPPGSRLPWHRIVAAPGRIARHPDSALQARRLRAEGVEVKPGGSVDLGRYGWRPA